MTARRLSAVAALLAVLVVAPAAPAATAGRATAAAPAHRTAASQSGDERRGETIPDVVLPWRPSPGPPERPDHDQRSAERHERPLVPPRADTVPAAAAPSAPTAARSELPQTGADLPLLLWFGALLLAAGVTLRRAIAP